MRKMLIGVAAMLLFNCVTAFAQDVEYRLPAKVAPTSQEIFLTLDPDKTTFSGRTVIHLDVKKPSESIGFYQQGLNIKQASLKNEDESIALTVEDGDYDISKASAEETIPAGSYTLHIEFDGKVNTTSDGMYVSSFEGNNYLFTQFEDMHARKAFPSFDEPSFKIPYQVTITAPEGLTVVSNTPVESRDVQNDMQTVRFMETKPMPSYLVAYAAGPFDKAPITGLSVPGNIYVPKGHADKTKFVVEHTPEILESLETFFGVDYPYKKLDFVAVPNFTHGAMENAGLITYRHSLLLLPEEPDLNARARPLQVVAHELAHQWYGNLVTMAWWDDLWLNEAFASWMASYVMMELYPELNFDSRIVQEAAFGADANPTAKPVKKEVRIQSDAMDGLGLNYSKGESVLQMIESLIGTEQFQKGVRAYINKHAWGNTQADDLWAALDKVSDFNLSAMMKGYLEQPGYPLLTFSSGGNIVQTRFHFAGAKVEDQVWSVPLKVTYKKNGEIKQTLVVIDKADSTVPELSEADWIFPNHNATGYFRWKITPAQMTNLLSDLDALNAREKKNVLYNVKALLDAKQASVSDVMTVLEAMANSEEPEVVRASVSTLEGFDYLVNEQNRAQFAQLVDKLYLPILNTLTLTPAEDDSEATLSLRASLYDLLGRYSNDEALLEKSEKLAKQYIKDSDSVPSNLADTAIKVVTRQEGSDKWFERLIAAYEASDDPTTKQTLLYSMRFTSDDMITKMLDLALSDYITPANTIYMPGIASRIKDDQSVLYAWLNNHFDEMVAKMPDYHVSRMPEFVSTTCFPDNYKLAKDFYSTRMKSRPGMARSFEVMSNETEQCIRLKSTYQEAFDQFIENADAR